MKLPFSQLVLLSFMVIGSANANTTKRPANGDSANSPSTYRAPLRTPDDKPAPKAERRSAPEPVGVASARLRITCEGGRHRC
jgi:hypothetical protein